MQLYPKHLHVLAEEDGNGVKKVGNLVVLPQQTFGGEQITHITLVAE